jgi:hypothetical protein
VKTNSDRSDFKELAVWQIQEMLESAYRAGYSARQEEIEPRNPFL